MIIPITVITGLAIYTFQIILHETNNQIRQVIDEVNKLTKDGAIYPKAKPIQLPPMRKTSIKPAPLYHVILK